jgi:threonine aldolase
MFTYAARVASLGDDVFSMDECTNVLEAHIAKLAGKEAGLFVLSGTMSNQLALRTLLTQPPYRCVCSSLRSAFVSTDGEHGSVLGDHRAHVWKYETSGASFLSAAQFIPIKPENGET